MNNLKTYTQYNDAPIIRIAKKQNIPLDKITYLDCCNNQLTSLV